MRFLRSGEGAIHYEIIGRETGKIIVFVNSLGTDLRIWEEVVEELQSDFQCICYDKRGHGLSDCPPGPYTISDFSGDLGRMLDSLNIEPFLLVGISIGGLIAMDYALAGGRTHGLIIADSAPRIGTADLWQQRIDGVSQNGLPHMAPDIAKRWFGAKFQDQRPAEMRGYTNMLSQQPANGYVASCAALRDADLGDRVREMLLPTLVLCGEEDLAVMPEHCRQFADSLPNARFSLISGAGHLPCIEQPISFARQVREFAGAMD